MSDLGWTEYITLEEEANENACIGTAKKYGYTKEEALECDSMDLDCSDCPFKKERARE